MAVKSTSNSIAVITCSTRPSRIGHHVTTYLTNSVFPAQLPQDQSVTLTVIDLTRPPGLLPLLDEPGIPQGHPREDPTPHYVNEHSRLWSAEVLKHDAFVFVTPQYNWGYPAAIKNALDYLYWEWNSKPAMVISYGNRGGNLANEQLRQVLKGVRMRVVGEGKGQLKIAVSEGEKIREEGKILDAVLARWRDGGVEVGVVEEFRDLLELMTAQG